MKRTFLEIIGETFQSMKSQTASSAQISAQSLSTYSFVKFGMIFAVVLFIMYYLLEAPSVDMIFATFFTMSAVKFLIYFFLASWASYFLLSFIIVFLRIGISANMKNSISLALSIVVLFFMISVLKINYVHDNIESKAIASLEGHLAVEISAQSFEKSGDETYIGTAHIMNSDENKIISYTVVTTPYKSGRRSYDYDVEIEYDFVDSSK